MGVYPHGVYPEWLHMFRLGFSRRIVPRIFSNRRPFHFSDITFISLFITLLYQFVLFTIMAHLYKNTT